MAKTTIYDVAGAAKVSLATVSRVMNNPEKVNKETRDKVLRVIKELGYKPNAIARGLASRKSTTVGIIVSDISRAAMSQLLGGLDSDEPHVRRPPCPENAGTSPHRIWYESNHLGAGR